MADRSIPSLRRRAQPTTDPVYFLHIPKTSGSSVREFFVNACGPDQVSSVLVWDDILTGKQRLDAGFRVVIGHFGGLLPLWLHHWPRIITILREPAARALSHINHVQRDTSHRLHTLAAGLSVREYCQHPALRKTIDNFQSRYLASLAFARALMPREPSGDVPFGERAIRFENALYDLNRESALHGEAVAALDTLDAVGLCEAHAESLELFAKTLALDVPPGGPESRVNVAVGGVAIENLSNADLELLRSLNAVDCAVYEHARGLFARSCRERSVTLRKELSA